MVSRCALDFVCIAVVVAFVRCFYFQVNQEDSKSSLGTDVEGDVERKAQLQLQ